MFNKLTKSYLINSLVDVHDLLFTHPDLKKNVELKDKYNNERIFILGSGNSYVNNFINVDFFGNKMIDYGMDLRFPFKIETNFLSSLSLSINNSGVPTL